MLRENKEHTHNICNYACTFFQKQDGKSSMTDLDLTEVSSRKSVKVLLSSVILKVYANLTLFQSSGMRNASVYMIVLTIIKGLVHNSDLTTDILQGTELYMNCQYEYLVGSIFAIFTSSIVTVLFVKFRFKKPWKEATSYIFRFQ